jgi:hypothetical protein
MRGGSPLDAIVERMPDFYLAVKWRPAVPEHRWVVGSARARRAEIRVHCTAVRPYTVLLKSPAAIAAATDDPSWSASREYTMNADSPSPEKRPTRGSATAEDRRAEFKAYRQEILDRSGHQHTLLTLNLTAVSAAGGLVLTEHGDARVLLLLPIISSSIGLLWYDHARNIDSLGDYIRDDLELYSGYEERIARLERNEYRRVPMTLALFILFVATPIAGLLVPFRSIAGPLWSLWGLGLVLSAVCSWLFVRWMVEAFRD